MRIATVAQTAVPHADFATDDDGNVGSKCLRDCVLVFNAHSRIMGMLSSDDELCRASC